MDFVRIDKRDPLAGIVLGVQREHPIPRGREILGRCAVKEKPSGARKGRCVHDCEIRGAFFARIVVDDEAIDDVSRLASKAPRNGSSRTPNMR